MKLIIKDNYDAMCEWAANHIAGRINAFGPTPDKPFVIGLPTGSTPLGTDKELINLYNAGKVSFETIYSVDGKTETLSLYALVPIKAREKRSLNEK